MKVLSVKNPWAWLIIHCRKDVENRTWHTNYRGRILIHASKKSAEKIIIPSYITYDEINFLSAIGKSEETNGCIIGSVEIADCVQNYPSRWAEKDAWHWVLKNREPFKEPIPAKGKLGLWEYTEVKK